MSEFRLMETKTIQTANDPEAIAASHEYHARHFWNVQNVQITHFKDSRVDFETYGSTTVATTTTETTQYATITYERDKRLPHYDELVRMEAAMDKAAQAAEYGKMNIDQRKPSKWRFWVGKYCFVAAIMTLMQESSGAMKTFSFFASAVWIALGIYLHIKGRKRNVELAKEQEYYRKKLNEELIPCAMETEDQLNALLQKIAEELNA